MLSHSAVLYLATVLIWGSTFFAIRFQLGSVPETVSIGWRFTLATLMLMGWCLWKGVPLRFDRRAHGWMFLQGVFLFGLNYVLVYFATERLTSGLIAVLFSTIVFMNILNGALFLRRRTTVAVLGGASMGLLGIALVFWPELMHLEGRSEALTGMLLGLGGTYIASLGNVISARNQAAGLPVVQTNAWGMAYGALLTLGWALLSGQPLRFEWTLPYVSSLVYLALFGSVLAFGAYLTLLGRIGADKAAYAMVLFPLVALGLSTLFEGYQWTPESLAGMVLVVLGNVVMMARPERLMFWRRRVAA